MVERQEADVQARRLEHVDPRILLELRNVGEGRGAGQVDGAAEQRRHACRLLGDQRNLDGRGGRLAGDEIALVGGEGYARARLVSHDLVGAGADGAGRERGRRPVLEDVLGHDLAAGAGVGEIAQHRREGAVGLDLDRQRVDGAHFLHRIELGPVRRSDGFVLQAVDGELDVLGRDRRAVVERRALAQPEAQHRRADHLVAFGQIGLDAHLGVELEQAVEDPPENIELGQQRRLRRVERVHRAEARDPRAQNRAAFVRDRAAQKARREGQRAAGDARLQKGAASDGFVVQSCHVANSLCWLDFRRVAWLRAGSGRRFGRRRGQFPGGPNSLRVSCW